MMLNIRKTILILSGWLFLVVNVGGQSYLVELDLNDIWGQGTLRVFDRSDTTEVLAYAAEERFELVTTKLDKSGAVVFQEFGDTLVSGVKGSINLGDSTFLVNVGTAPHKSFFTVVSGNKVVDVAEHEVFSEDVQAYAIVGQTVFDEYLIFSGKVLVEDGLRGFVLWVDRETLVPVRVEIAEEDYTSIGGIASSDKGLFGIMIQETGQSSGDFDWYLTEFFVDRSMEKVLRVYEGRQALSTLTDKMVMISNRNRESVTIASYTPDGKSIRMLNYEDEIKWISDTIVLKTYSPHNLRLFPTSDGGFVHVYDSNHADDIERGTDYVPVISRYDRDGNILWSKIFKRFGTDDKSKYDAHGFTFEETENYFIFGGLEVRAQAVTRPIILKITKDGCLLPDCGPMQVMGYHPEPKTTISSRNIWHVYNTETDERFRYTWIDKYIAYVGGTLLRSDEMSGDNWYSVRDNYISGENALDRISTIPDDIVGIDYEYNYGFTIGQKNNHYFPPDFDNINQEVIKKDTINFLDGRRMRRLELVCTHNHEVLEDFKPRTWIELVGDPNDVFNTENACRNPGHDVVTCFYSSGNLMWTHPEYGEMCGLTSTEGPSESSNPPSVYPNPTDHYLTLTSDYEDLRIISREGTLAPAFQGPAKSGTQIDVSSLRAGLYYIFDATAPRETVVTFGKY